MITSNFPPETISLESSRHASMSDYDIKVCFAGQIKIVGQSNSSLAFMLNDVPVFGFMNDLCVSIRKLLDGENTVEFMDFYGEYCIEIKLDSCEKVSLRNKWDQGIADFFLPYFLTSVQSWIERVDLQIKDKIPVFSRNPVYTEMIMSFRKLIRD